MTCLPSLFHYSFSISKFPLPFILEIVSAKVCDLFNDRRRDVAMVAYDQNEYVRDRVWTWPNSSDVTILKKSPRGIRAVWVNAWLVVEGAVSSEILVVWLGGLERFRLIGLPIIEGGSVGGTRRRGSRLHGRNRYIGEKGHGEVEGKRQRGSLPLHEAH